MKLYFAPGACSRAAHIMLIEADVELELEKVDFASYKTTSGTDYLTINPLGYVPALELRDDVFLTENSAVLPWIAEAYGDYPATALGRARLAEELSFLSSELHKAYSPFFSKTPPEGEAKTAAMAKIRSRITHYEQTYLKSDRPFDVAQAYAFVILSWSGYVGFDLSEFPLVVEFMDEIAQRPSVKAAIAAEEGLVPA